MRKKKNVSWGMYRPADIVFTTLDIPLLRQKYRPGQKIVIRKRYTVVEVYEHHLSCVDRSGMRESFHYIELEQCVVGG